MRSATADLPPGLGFDQWEEWGLHLQEEAQRVEMRRAAIKWKIVQWLTTGQRLAPGKVAEIAACMGLKRQEVMDLKSLGEKTFSVRTENPKVYELDIRAAQEIQSLPPDHQSQVVSEAFKSGQTSQRKFINYVAFYKERVGLAQSESAQTPRPARPVIPGIALEAVGGVHSKPLVVTPRNI